MLTMTFIYFKSFKRDKAGLHFHLAAQSFPKTSFDIPLDTLNTNIMAANLLEAKMLGLKTWIQICSSSEVFKSSKR